MVNWVRVLFLVHALVALAFGVFLLVAPGLLLAWVGWAPIDPLMSRLLGAALLALAWSSFRGWRAKDWTPTAIVVEAEVVFTVLGCAGMLRHLLKAPWPIPVWGLFGVLAIFAIAWIVALLQHAPGRGSAG